MTARRQWLIVGVVLVALGAALGIGVMTSGGAKILGPGAPAPDFTAVTVPDSGAGAPKHVANYRGRPVLLNMWATWCAPCRDEMPRIEKLYEQLGDSGLQVVAVSIDNPGMTDAIRDFRKEMGLRFEILHDESGRIRDDYQTTGVPETFLIDAKGVVRRRLIGAAWTVDEQLPLLRELLAEPAK
ncbi:MAG TPA: TlpA disulfide reductase family protein [Gemmatimonadaceae bacterium]|nr:TlpA disulfide reductase family protein [Gemmatimonadaceae bacterium]